MASNRPTLHDADRYWAAKLAGRIVATIASLIGIGCTAWVISKASSGNIFGYEDDNDNWSVALIPWVIISLGLSVLWNMTNIIVLFVRRRPVHPGANVGCDLIIWLTLIVTGLFASFGAAYWIAYNYDNYEDDGDGDCYGYGYNSTSYDNGSTYDNGYNNTYGCGDYGPQDISQAQKFMTVEWVACGFAYLALGLHFALFVWACVDTHKLRKSRVDDRAGRMAQAMIAEMTSRGVFPGAPMPQQPYHNYQYSPLQPAGMNPMPSYYAPVPAQQANTNSVSSYYNPEKPEATNTASYHPLASGQHAWPMSPQPQVLEHQAPSSQTAAHSSNQ